MPRTTKPAKAQTLAQMLTEAAHHLREHAAHYDHQSPRDLPAQLIKAAGAMSRRTSTLELTAAELNGLAALAGEGAEGLLNDPAAARAYIGTGAQIAAAKRAHEKLDSANARANNRLASKEAP